MTKMKYLVLSFHRIKESYAQMILAQFIYERSEWGTLFLYMFFRSVVNVITFSSLVR